MDIVTRADRPQAHRVGATAARHRLIAWLAVPVVAGALLVSGSAAVSADPLGEGEGANATEGVLAPPTVEELAAQKAEAERLAAEVDNHELALRTARRAIDELSQSAADAREAEQVALDAQAAAVSEQSTQLQRLDAATILVRSRQGELGRWASQVYRDGGQLGGIEDLMSLLESDNTDDLSQRVATLEIIGRWRGSVVDTVEEAQAVQEDATLKAQSAADQATVAAGQAVVARQLADSLLEQQRGQVALLQALLATTSEAAAAADEETRKLAEARAAAEQRRLDAGSGQRRDNRVSGPVGDCVGGDVSSYPNGAIPLENLCPLWAAPGHRMRADAAFGFNRMSEAYAMAFGDPICVTDSYRDYAGQVAVHESKPNLAATPGTSNHGWGTALDLCGGIQTFGSPQHEWMRANAPLYGFFHPGWAQQGGSKPEPWHWEFGG